MEMKSKNLFGFFLTFAFVLFLAVGAISAATTDIAVTDPITERLDSVKVGGIYDEGNEDISIIAGETLPIVVVFTAFVDASDVRIEAELQGTKLDIEADAFVGDIEQGKRYIKSLSLRVPYELKDEVNDDISLLIKIWNGDYKTEHPEIVLRIQRPSYEVGVMSVTVDQEVDAGAIFPIDVVLKNIGYNYLDDLYVTVTISALEVEKSTYIGDLDATEDKEDEDDTLRARIYLKIPYDAPAGVYALEVEVRNDDLVESEVVQVIINNDFANNVIATDYSKTFDVGERAEYEILLVNPTNKLKVYRIITESSGSLTTSAGESVVAVPSGLSKTVRIIAKADAKGNYDFDVNILSGEELVGTVTLNANVESGAAESAIIALTLILTIVFIVLLIVLVVLLRKKPEKAEEFGESYY